jgi:hypothetical protein
MFLSGNSREPNRPLAQSILPVLLWLVTLVGCGTLEVGIEDPEQPLVNEDSASETIGETPETVSGAIEPVVTPVAVLTRTVAEPNPLEIAFFWSGEMKGDCQTLHINYAGEGAIGACKQSAREWIPLDGRFAHVQLWPYWIEHFAPFDVQTPRGQVSLIGLGQEQASPAWQRAMGLWGELVWVELETEGRSESWTTALDWHQETVDQPGYCQTLHVFMYGMARASHEPCLDADPESSVEDWLTTVEWEQFDAWYYSKTGASGSNLEFYGIGPLEMDVDEIEQLDRWAEAVFNRLILQGLIGASGQPEPTPTPVSNLSETHVLFTDPDLGLSFYIPLWWDKDVIPGAATHFYSLDQSDTRQDALTMSAFSPESTTLDLALIEAEKGAWGSYFREVQTVQLGEFEALRLTLSPGGDRPPVIWLLVAPSGRAVGFIPRGDLTQVEAVLNTLFQENRSQHRDSNYTSVQSPIEPILASFQSRASSQ